MSCHDYLTRTFGDPLSEAIRERVQHPDITQRKDIALKCLRAYDKQEQWLAKQIAKEFFKQSKQVSSVR